eukprot:scaffold3551_cov118-Isochrysis_galbana.AAC.9
MKAHQLVILGVRDDRDVRREHHQLAARVLELHRPVPLLDGPWNSQQQREVSVCESGGGRGPRPRVARGVRVASAKGVGAGQGDDLLVVEAHAVEDVLSQGGDGVLGGAL